MKNKILVTVVSLVLLLCGHAIAQNANGVPDVYYTPLKATGGLKLGANFGMMNGKEAFTNSYNEGVKGGVYIGSRNEYLGVKCELLLSSSRFSLQDTFQNGGHLSNFNLDVPVMLDVKVIPILWAQLGLQYSTLIASTQDPSGNEDPKTWFQTRNFSVLAGLECKVYKNFVLGARYVYGLTDIKSPKQPYIAALPSAWKNSTIETYLAFKVF